MIRTNPTPPELRGWWGGICLNTSVGPPSAHRKGLKHAFYYIVQSQKQSKTKQNKNRRSFIFHFWQRGSASFRGGIQRQMGGGTVSVVGCTEVAICFHLGVSALFSFRPTAEGKVKTRQDMTQQTIDLLDKSCLILTNNKVNVAPVIWRCWQ